VSVRVSTSELCTSTEPETVENSPSRSGPKTPRSRRVAAAARQAAVTVRMGRARAAVLDSEQLELHERKSPVSATVPTALNSSCWRRRRSRQGSGFCIMPLSNHDCDESDSPVHKVRSFYIFFPQAAQCAACHGTEKTVTSFQVTSRLDPPSIPNLKASRRLRVLAAAIQATS
jgi:hypothetical protein